MSYYQQKVVWITGASSGIGEQLANSFAKQGAHLILSARNMEELNRVKSDCEPFAASVSVEPIDIGELDTLPNVFSRLSASMAELMFW